MRILLDFLKEIIYFLCKVYGIILPYKRIEKLSILNKILYTYWIKNEFKSFGEKSIISYPLDLKGRKCVEIGNGVSIGKNSIINAWEKHLEVNFTPQIVIGNNTILVEGCHISSIEKIIIGNNVLTGRRISIIDNSHWSSSLLDFYYLRQKGNEHQKDR